MKLIESIIQDTRVYISHENPLRYIMYNKVQGQQQYSIKTQTANCTHAMIHVWKEFCHVMALLAVTLPCPALAIIAASISTSM